MKNLENYNTTYDRKLTAMLGQFLAYTCSTTDSKEDQKELANKVLKALEDGFNNSIG